MSKPAHYHVGTYGGIQTGKTALNKILAKAYKESGTPVLLYDPEQDPAWPCTWRTNDPDTFMKKARNSAGCALFIDEAEDVMPNRKGHDRGWLTKRAHHQRHRTHLITQDPVDLLKKARKQISLVYVLRMGRAAAGHIADVHGHTKTLKDKAPTLDDLEYFKLERGDLERESIDPKEIP
jgi:hypothetical protein